MEFHKTIERRGENIYRTVFEIFHDHERHEERIILLLDNVRYSKGFRDEYEHQK